MRLDEKIIALRKARGMSQEELAENLGISRQAVSRWETASAQPDASNVLQLSKLFGVSADYLLNEEYQSDKDIPAVKNSNRKAKSAIRKIISICAALFGAAGNFTIYVLSRFIEVMVPVVTRNGDNVTYTWRSDITGFSYKYFVQHHNLEPLVIALWIITIIGLVIAFVPKEKLEGLKTRLLSLKRKK